MQVKSVVEQMRVVALVLAAACVAAVAAYSPSETCEMLQSGVKNKHTAR